MRFDILILAAGFGSRLKSFTRQRPKALVEYKSKKLIEIQLSNINKNNIHQVIVVTGYKSSILENYLKNKFYGLKFIFVKNLNYKKNSSGQSFFYAYKFIKTHQYIHLNCDCIFSKKHISNLLFSNFNNVISVRNDIKLAQRSENVEVYQNKIKKMTLEKNQRAKYRAFGVAKISKKEMLKNINLYKSLKESEKFEINYFSLIRKNIEKGSIYNILRSNKYNLTEINTQEDKKKSKILC